MNKYIVDKFIVALQKENERLKEVLQFYADERNWSCPEYAGRDSSLSVVQCDKGQRARDHLK